MPAMGMGFCRECAELPFPGGVVVPDNRQFALQLHLSIQVGVRTKWPPTRNNVFS